MSYLDRKDLLSADLMTRSITKEGSIKYYNTDKNVANIYMKLMAESPDGAQKEVAVDEASNYTVTIDAIKSKTNQIRTVPGVLSNDLTDETCAIWKFELGEDLTNQIGEVICQTYVKNTTQNLTMRYFAYTVEADKLTGLNSEIVTDPDLPILKELIKEVQETAQTVNNIDNVNVSDTKTYSNKKIEEKFSGVDAQFNTVVKGVNFMGTCENTFSKLLNKENAKIVCIGDSLTFGRGTTSSAQVANPYPKVLNEHLKLLYSYANIEVINKGITGDTARKIDERLQSDVIDLNPNMCILQVGTNDATFGSTIESFTTRFTNIITKLKNSNIDVVVMIPPPLLTDQELNGALGRFKTIIGVIEDVCKREKIKYVNNYEFYNYLYDNDIEKEWIIQNDSIHFIEGAYRYMAYNLIKNVFNHNIKICSKGNERIRFFPLNRDLTPYYKGICSRLTLSGTKFDYVVFIDKSIAGQYYKFNVYVDKLCKLNILSSKTKDSGSFNVRVNGVLTKDIDMYNETSIINHNEQICDLNVGVNIIEVLVSDLKQTTGTATKHYFQEFYLTNT